MAKTLRDLRRAAAAATRAEVAVEERRRERDALALEVYESGEVTYDALAEAMSVTRDRISQVLAEQRRLRAST